MNGVAFMPSGAMPFALHHGCGAPILAAGPPNPSQNRPTHRALKSPKKPLAILLLVRYNPPNGSTQFTHPGPEGRRHHGGAARGIRRGGRRAGRPARPDLRLPPAHHGPARTPHHPLAVRPARPHPHPRSPRGNPAGAATAARRRAVNPPIRHPTHPPPQARARARDRDAHRRSSTPTIPSYRERARSAATLAPSPGRFSHRHLRCRTPPYRPPSDFRPSPHPRFRTSKMLRYRN